jgi:hypothetical protein
MKTTRPARNPTAERLVMELIRSGLIFSETLGSLIDSVEESGAYPGENAGEVVVAMAAGSVQNELSGRSPDEVERAIDLIVVARDRLITDLKLATELSRRREQL